MATIQPRASTPAPDINTFKGNPISRRGSSASLTLSTPKLQQKDRLTSYLAEHKGGKNTRLLDPRHGGGVANTKIHQIKNGEGAKKPRMKIDAQGNVTEREHGDIVGMHEWQAEEAESFMRLDQGNFNEVPKTPDPDDIFGTSSKEYEERAPMSVVGAIHGNLDGALSKQDIEKIKQEVETKGAGNNGGDVTTRTVDSMGSIVGREAQAENLRIKELEQTLRSKLMSMVPGKNELQKAFKFFDVDDSACVDAAEFRKVFKQLNIPLEMAEAKYLFEKYDTDKSKKVEYYEFISQFIPPDTNYNWRDFSSMGRIGFDRVHLDLRVQKMVELLRNDVGPSRLRNYFKRLGTPAPGNEGKLTLLSFVNGMEKEGYKLTSKQWQWALEILDKDKSGFISADEFCFSFGTQQGNKQLLNGPGEETSDTYNGFFKPRDDIVAAPAVRVRTQAQVPTTLLSGDAEAASEKLPLDADLTTCVDAVRGLKRDFRAQKISMAEFFRKFDLNGNGWISRSEFDQGLRKMGYEMSKTEIAHMIRSFGVMEWEEGLSEHQFNELLTDDICDDYMSVRGDINDGRSAIKMGVTSKLPRGIQPGNGDRVQTPGGTTTHMKLDPMHRTLGASGEKRKKLYSPSSMGSTLLPARRTQKNPHERLQEDDALREALHAIQESIDEKGIKGTFDWLDDNRNFYLTRDDLQLSMHKLNLSDVAAESLCDFLDHNGDGNVSFKDFQTSMAEVSRSIPDNQSEAASMTRTTGRHLISPELRYTSRFDHGMGSFNCLKTPSRYGGRRRVHDTLDGPIGTSAEGAAGVLRPRADSPLFLNDKACFLRKNESFDAGIQRTHNNTLGWQQQLINTDHDKRRSLSKARQNAIDDFRKSQIASNQQKCDRLDKRAETTNNLKKNQIFRYQRTVYDPKFE